MKRWMLVTALTCASAATSVALATASPPDLPPTWHVHDCVSSCVLPHAGVAFFPAILTGGNVAAYLQDPAACPDATDKAFLGGGQPPTSDGVEQNQPLREGVCMTSTTIVHLKSIAPDSPAPNGWTYLSTAGGYATYYMLTATA